MDAVAALREGRVPITKETYTSSEAIVDVLPWYDLATYLSHIHVESTTCDNFARGYAARIAGIHSKNPHRGSHIRFM